jgi:glycosyltransferase involved in cell wall biosynthesis
VSELVVLSHLRWVFVWQRPQHLISRLAVDRPRTWFIEEPLPGDVAEPTLRTEEHGPVTRVWLEVPGPDRHIDFTADEASGYGAELASLLDDAGERTVWLYTPLAFDLARSIGYDLLVYDSMDDLASFKGAPAGLRAAQKATLEEADVVFAGGRSLFWSLRAERPDAHLLPSGVEPEHYAVERHPRPAGQPPVAGYVGVIDERIDLDLVAELAASLPEWEIRMVGPVVKIDAASLPAAPNITYPGPQRYEDLPHVMAGFDVALMPFALNEATKSISPTKTLEYLAAGLPVVSTRVPDVVADYGAVVHLADDGAGFAVACRAELRSDPDKRRATVEPLLRLHHWDAIADRMTAVMDKAGATRRQAAVDGRRAG